jgi:serine/threonine protein kinase
MPPELAVRGPDGIVGPRSPQCAEPFRRSLESFFNEARLLAPFNHPALVRVHRFWKANGTAYMAMQYCPGLTLMEARRRMRAPPDEAWLRAVVEPILDALERLHRAGVFHRDISPDNILLLPNGRPILLDFGSARRVAGSGTRVADRRAQAQLRADRAVRRRGRHGARPVDRSLCARGDGSTSCSRARRPRRR